MNTPLNLLTLPPALPSASMIAVDRAVAELRRGGIVVIVAKGGDGGTILQAAEAVTPTSLSTLSQLAGTAPGLAITIHRAAVLSLPLTFATGTSTVVLWLEGGFDAETVVALTQPTSGIPPQVPENSTILPTAPPSAADAAVRLTKLARLLPAALVASFVSSDVGTWARERNLPIVATNDVLDYEPTVAASLRPVSEARVPLAAANDTRVIAFRPADGGIEHLALIIGEPDRDTPVLVRLHSECFTGDLLGSLRCDCGDQLRGAIKEIDQAGSGILLYLAQEGRGIGLVNKLRAYQLQDNGFDTLDANRQLGFDDDERVYLPAAEMLRQLGVLQVRLLTNNPFKVEAMAQHGIEVVERVPHVFPANGHNLLYLKTKATKGGHLF